MIPIPISLIALNFFIHDARVDLEERTLSRVPSHFLVWDANPDERAVWTLPCRGGWGLACPAQDEVGTLAAKCPIAPPSNQHVAAPSSKTLTLAACGVGA
ncbi:hypothetical protein CHELA1G11_12789 [Hyphomicrobiales bacterium]|nr:hypothetical protein CHELA1G2_11518 [Hyphomicrobiales bacterium]CAH1667137.1 hypothetical protein CHELA1G11_12789 [Hyphomicrobiales bacterium]